MTLGTVIKEENAMADQVSLFRTMQICYAAALLAGNLSLVEQALAQDSQTGRRDEKAIAVLQGMSDYLSKEQTISFRARTFFDVVQEDGIKIKTAREVDVILKRPNHLQANTLDDTGTAASAWYDGSKVTVWRKSANEVMTLDYADNTDKLLDDLVDKYEFQIPLADLLYSDVSKALGENIISSEYIGLRMVDGVPCHLISFESDGADWQMWVEADTTPVPRRFVIDHVIAEHQPQFMAQLDAWSLGGEYEDSRFTAIVPEGVKQVEFQKAAAEP
jgi:hypothetical protein